MSQDAAIDYTNAVKYVGEFFNEEEAIVDDFGEAMDRAVQIFSDRASIKDTKVNFSLLGLLIDAVGIALPHLKVVKNVINIIGNKVTKTVAYEIWDDLPNKEAIKALAGKGYESLEEKARTGIKDVFSKENVDTNDDTSLKIFSAGEREKAGRLGRTMTKIVLVKRSVMMDHVEELQKKNPALAGKLAPHMRNLLGPKPSYNPAEIDKFERQFEKSLYRGFFGSKAYVLHTITDHGFGQFTHDYSIEKVPTAVQKRMMELSGMLSPSFALMDWNLRIVTKRERAVYASPKYGL